MIKRRESLVRIGKVKEEEEEKEYRRSRCCGQQYIGRYVCFARPEAYTPINDQSLPLSLLAPHRYPADPIRAKSSCN